MAQTPKHQLAQYICAEIAEIFEATFQNEDADYLDIHEMTDWLRETATVDMVADCIDEWINGKRPGQTA